MGITAASSIPTHTVTSTSGVGWEGKDPEFDVLFTQFNVDYDYFETYQMELTQGRAFRYFMFLAIFISCLGLFGLASFVAEQRTLEIGIRKVLGASVPGIFVMLLKDFVKWVLLASAISWPLAYFVMDRWLQNFAYRTDVALCVFLVSGILGLAVAVATVSYQSLRALVANPADSLRYE